MASIEAHGTAIAIKLEAEEAEILRRLLGETKELIEQENVIQDAVVDRLFPAAYSEPEDARAFAELIGDELRTNKLTAINSVLSVIDQPGEVETILPRSEVDDWLTVLTDVRLALGTRFDVTEEKMSAELDPEDPEAGGMAVLHWLGWMQEMFIRAITEGSDDGSVDGG